ncbi:MAG: transposase family protein [Nitrospirota bacterium]
MHRASDAHPSGALVCDGLCQCRLANGRRFKCLTMTDPYSKEVPVIEVDGSIGGERVCRILDRVFAGRSMQEVLMLDNGTEFAGNTLDTWAD